jgi:hypothetical protein
MKDIQMVKNSFLSLALSAFALSGIVGFAAAGSPTSAIAQVAPHPTTTPHPTSAPATANAQAAAHPTTASPIKELVADPATAAILEKYLTGITTHPALPQFDYMTLEEAMPMSQGEVTPEKIAAIEAEIKALSAH